MKKKKKNSDKSNARLSHDPQSHLITLKINQNIFKRTFISENVETLRAILKKKYNKQWKDIFQESVVRFLTTAVKIKNDQHAISIFYLKVREVFRDTVFKIREERSYEELLELGLEILIKRELPDQESPEQKMEQEEKMVTIRKSVRRLSQEKQLILKLRFWDELTLRETAHKTGKTINQCYSIERQAKKELYRFLVEYSVSKGRK